MFSVLLLLLFCGTDSAEISQLAVIEAKQHAKKEGKPLILESQRRVLVKRAISVHVHVNNVVATKHLLSI